MKHIKVADLMTDEVASVTPDTPFKEVAKLLAQYDVSGLPVLDDEDHVVGVVSQTDLLARSAAVPGPGAQIVAPPSRPPTTRDLMSAPAVTVHAEETVGSAARLMTRRGIERLPVVDVEDRLVGIVTRRDLLRTFLRPDAEIRRRVQDALTDLADISAEAVEVHVVDGIVTLEGTVHDRSRLPVLIALVERIDGVVAVAPRITARPDDPANTRAGHHAMPG
ncbi:CBS domain-containing protein [Streptomyces yangpuensis]|uniref:CBS domain-containing protein n=1 Tax=Streptomyces yangpuensis TaxID=1648182 RepID=A0ABY5PPV3_9ACTN|nr:CBS domain-containing protein [Streptomyces yangpuensis]MBZ9599464.1 CBS domain-containing protein [Streptomyces erythrochromogenes]UUY46061.1 CBS domain-containing protein [Streptomyces yangpuensis]